MSKGKSGADDGPDCLRFLNDSPRLLLRTIYEWCFVGRTHVMPSGFRFPMPISRVPWEFLVAELHGKLDDLETTIRLLREKGLIEDTGFISAPALTIPPNPGTSECVEWELSDKRSLRFEIHYAPRKYDRDATLAEQAIYHRQRIPMEQLGYDCRIFIDGKRLGLGEGNGIYPPAVRDIKLTKPGIEAAEAIIATAPPTTGTTGKTRGRPVDTDPKRDEQLYTSWKSGMYETYADCAKEHEMSVPEFKRAIDRHKKRLAAKSCQEP